MWTLAVLLALSCVGVFAECPYGFIENGDSCYMFVGQNATWIEAKKYCDVLGGDLVVIDSAAEETFLEDTLKKIHGQDKIHPENYWIDGTDIIQEGQFRWMGKNGNSREISSNIYTHWAPGQPDNAGTTENCMEIRFSFNISWNDYLCDVKQNFICEASIEWEGDTLFG